MDKINKYLIEKKNFKSPVVIAESPSGDWEGLYIKGKLFIEGHSISRYDFIKALEKAGVLKKNSIESYNVDEAWIEQVGQLPKKLEEVKWE